MTAAATIDATRTAPVDDRSRRDELLRRLLDAPRRRPPVAPADASLVVTILTVDRPHALERCLRSVTAQCDALASEARVIVVDGSTRCQDQVRRIAQQYASRHPVGYVGADEVAGLRSSLARAGVPGSVIHATVSPDSGGAHRNLAALLAAGHKLVLCDDSVRLDAWSLPDPETRLTLGGHTDGRRWRFFADRAAALHDLPRTGANVLGAHREALGRRLSDFVADPALTIEADGACAHLTDALACEADLQVRATVPGLAGHCDRYCPWSLMLGGGGGLKHAVTASRDAFATAMTTREVRHIAPNITLVHYPAGFASHCVGISNDALLPPFMPVGRGDDLVFACLLAQLDRRSLVAHLPLGIVNDADRPSRYELSAMRSATQTRMAEVVLCLARLARESMAPASVATNLRVLGAFFVETAAGSTESFAEIVKSELFKVRALQIKVLRRAADDASAPDYWRQACASYSRAIAENLSNPASWIAREVLADTAPPLAWRRVQTSIGQFGELLAYWPDMWQAARAVALMHVQAARARTSRTASAGMLSSITRLHDDEEVARQHIESVRWPNGPCCPHCQIAGTAKVLGGTAMGPGWYHCVTCRRKFTVRVGTALERSHIPLRKWLHATAVISGSRRGVSVRQLCRMLRVSYRAALIMSRRIKQTMARDPAA